MYPPFRYPPAPSGGNVANGVVGVVNGVRSGGKWGVWRVAGSEWRMAKKTPFVPKKGIFAPKHCNSDPKTLFLSDKPN